MTESGGLVAQVTFKFKGAKMAWKDKEIAFLKSLREETDLDWKEITEEMNEQFDEKRTLNATRKAYKFYENDDISDDVLIMTHRLSGISEEKPSAGSEVYLTRRANVSWVVSSRLGFGFPLVT